MKTPIGNFAVVAFALLLVFAGLQGDESAHPFVTDNAIAQRIDENQGVVTERGKDVLRSNEPSEESTQQEFSFPNVFDALRLIF